jgi:glycosyltransferase involved in cell wall biosynthesis
MGVGRSAAPVVGIAVIAAAVGYEVGRTGQAGASMRILHLNDPAFVASGLVAALREAGHEAEVVIPAAPGARLSFPLKAAVVPARAGVAIATALGARRRAPDVVHLHYGTHFPAAWLSGRPWIAHLHGSDVRGVHPASAMGRYLGFGLRRASSVIVSTPDLLAWVAPFRSDAVFLPNPVDTSRFAPASEARTDVLVATTAHPVKGSDAICRVLAEVRRQRPATTVTVVRAGPDSARVITAAGPGAHVIEPVPHDHMPTLMASHRVSIGQFRLGVLSQVEVESMACAVPIITDFRFPDSYATPPPIAPSVDAAMAASTVLGLLDDEARRVAIGTAMRDWVVASHDSRIVTARVIEIYGALPRARRSSPTRNPLP